MSDLILQEYAHLYKNELLENVIPFWQQHSLDSRYGGFFSCLDYNGTVYDSDKFMWMLGRQTWLFSMIYDQIDKRKDWLEVAETGAAFMEEHGRDKKGDWYFSFTQNGRPLVQPCNIYSDCYAAMAFARLGRITNKQRYFDIAEKTLQRILERKPNPKGEYNKLVAGSRPALNFSLSMILCNLYLEMENLLDASWIESELAKTAYDMMNLFFDEDSGLVMESVNPDGSIANSFEGRLLNPGHVMEAMWFMMDFGKKRGDRALIEKAKNIVLSMLEKSWDNTWGGIFYLLDIRGFPLQQLEWDQKLWWVHVEALIALAKAHRFTGDAKCLVWFEKIHRYAWQHFRDDVHGEWFGYLNRRGEVLLTLKGGKWKGCFHLPRGLYEIWKTFESGDH